MDVSIYPWPAPDFSFSRNSEWPACLQLYVIYLDARDIRRYLSSAEFTEGNTQQRVRKKIFTPSFMLAQILTVLTSEFSNINIKTPGIAGNPTSMPSLRPLQRVAFLPTRNAS